MAKRVFLHIGPHKTGSTYIQKMLVEYRPQLREYGYEYPEVGQEAEFGHHRIVQALTAARYQAAESIIKSALASACDSVILSSENFDRLSENDLEALKGMLSGVDVTVLFVKRNAADLLFSTWQEEIKHGSTDDWALFFFNHINRPFASTIINPCLVLDRYSRFFPREHIRIIDYDLARFRNQDLFAHFAVAAGIQGFTPRGLGRVNVAMNIEHVEMIRLLNALAIQEGVKVNTNVRRAYITFARSNPGSEPGESLRAKVSGSLMDIQIAESFVFKRAAAMFNEKYGDRVLTDGEEAHPAGESGIRRLPHTSWYASLDAMQELQALWGQVRPLLNAPRR